MRADARAADQLRPVSIEVNVNRHAEGSCLVAFGDTRVMCTTSVEEKVPPFLRNSGKGWVTAEYGMLPRSTHTRSGREAAGAPRSYPLSIGDSAVFGGDCGALCRHLRGALGERNSHPAE